MGCCLFGSMLAGAPRLAIFLWWLFSNEYVSGAFDGVIWGILGFLFLPWTTLMWVMVYPSQPGVIKWGLLALAFAVDLGTYVGGGRGSRKYGR